MTEIAEKFESWALVEVMGHKQLAGRVSETTLAGAGFLRVDVPELPAGLPAFTKLLSPSAIYAITPIGEEEARRLAALLRERPVEVWRLDASRALPPARPAEVDEDEDEEDEDMEEDGAEVLRCRVCGCIDARARPEAKAETEGGCDGEVAQPVTPPQLLPVCDTCADEAKCERCRMAQQPILECPDYSMPF